MFTHVSLGTSVVGCTPWRQLRCGCQSTWLSIITPSPRDFSWDETGRVVPATSTMETAAAERSCAGVMPRIMTSNLLAFSCKPFHRNQDETYLAKIRGTGPLYGENFMILTSTVFDRSTRVTDRQTHRRAIIPHPLFTRGRGANATSKFYSNLYD